MVQVTGAVSNDKWPTRERANSRPIRKSATFCMVSAEKC